MSETHEREADVVMVVGSYFVGRKRDDGAFVPNHARIKQNIYMAENVARMVMGLNTMSEPLNRPVLAVTPHKNTSHFEQLTDVSEPVYQAGDRDLIRRLAKALIVIPNYVISSGTSKEIALANELGIPVFDELQSLRAFLRGEATLTETQVEVRGLRVQLKHDVNRTAAPLTMEDVMFFDHLADDCVPMRFYADGRGHVRGDQ